MIDNDKYWLKIVGTSFRIEAFEELFGRERDGINRLTTVHLMPEPSNPHDPNAVRAAISGLHVGYLSRDDAKLYQSLIDPQDGLEVEGFVNGGWSRGADRGYFGLRVAAPVEWRTMFDIDLDEVFENKTDDVL